MIAKATYQVEMCTDGKHKVVVTFEDPAGSRAAIAAARGIYSQLLRDEDLPDVVDRSATLSDEAPPLCGVHQLPMVLVQGKRGPFWSCHERNSDGSWCTYKPALA